MGLDNMQSLGHKADAGFQQMLEWPPLLPSDPTYRSLRCFFFEKGHCELGSTCTYAHSHSAPLTLNDLNKEDTWRLRSARGQVLMTHEQKYRFKEKETGQSKQIVRGPVSSHIAMSQHHRQAAGA